MSAREALMRHLTGASLCPPPRPVDEATGLLDAYREEVLAKAIARVKKIPVQCTALTGPVWFGQGWQDAIRAFEDVADYQKPDDTTDITPDFFKPGHSYTHRDGSDFRCLTVAAHPNTGEQRAFGWRIRNGWTEGATLDPDDWQQYDGCAEPTTGGAS